MHEWMRRYSKESQFTWVLVVAIILTPSYFVNIREIPIACHLIRDKSGRE